MMSALAEKTTDYGSATLLARLRIPAEVFRSYESYAAQKGITLEEAISERLTKCVSHDANKPLYFNDNQRQRLEQVLHRNYSNADEPISDIKRALSVAIQVDERPIVVTLDARVFNRLRSRCFTGGFSEFLRDRIVKCLEEYTGLR